MQSKPDADFIAEVRRQDKEEANRERWHRDGAGAYLKGRLRILPLYMGRTTVTAWRVEVLCVDGIWERRGSYDTLRAAKDTGDRINERH